MIIHYMIDRATNPPSHKYPGGHDSHSSGLGLALASLRIDIDRKFESVKSYFVNNNLTPLKQYGRPGFQAIRAIDIFSEEI
jgi:hypothetical protein